MKPKASPKWSWINLCTRAHRESSNICFPSCVNLLFGLISCGKRKGWHLYASNVQMYKSFPAEAVANFGISCFAPKTRRSLQWNSRWQQNPQQVLLLPLLSDRGRWALRRAAEESGPFPAGPERPSLPAALEDSHLSRERRSGHV